MRVIFYFLIIVFLSGCGENNQPYTDSNGIKFSKKEYFNEINATKIDMSTIKNSICKKDIIPKTFVDGELDDPNSDISNAMLGIGLILGRPIAGLVASTVVQEGINASKGYDRLSVYKEKLNKYYNEENCTLSIVDFKMYSTETSFANKLVQQEKEYKKWQQIELKLIVNDLLPTKMDIELYPSNDMKVSKFELTEILPETEKQQTEARDKRTQEMNTWINKEQFSIFLTDSNKNGWIRKSINFVAYHLQDILYSYASYSGGIFIYFIVLVCVFCLLLAILILSPIIIINDIFFYYNPMAIIGTIIDMILFMYKTLFGGLFMIFS